MDHVTSTGSARAERATSFGTVADDYNRFRPSPPAEALEWLFPEPVGTVVDVGAGTGALTRLLRSVATTVIAVEPDAGMRRQLTRGLPDVEILDGRAERMPLADGSADAVVASSSWHWVDQQAGMEEAARILRSGGLMAALWSGPDPDGRFMAQARAALAGSRENPVLGATVSGRYNPEFSLAIPDGTPFRDLECKVFHWDLALTADELVGLLATLSWVIVLPEPQRLELLDTARRLLRDALGIEGEVTADVDYSCTAYRCRRI